MFNQISGVGGQASSTITYPTDTTREPQPFESVGELGNTLLNISSSVRCNAQAVADCIGGPTPAINGQGKDAEPQNIGDLLRLLRGRLLEADAELARARKLLGV